MIVRCPSCYTKVDTEKTEIISGYENTKVTGGDHYVQDPKTRMYSVKETR